MRKGSYVYFAICFFSVISLVSCYLVQTCRAPYVVSFGLSADPSSLTIPLGNSAQSLINVSVRGNPSPLTVSLSASSLGGVSTDFNPQQVIVLSSFPSDEWNSNQSILAITVSHAASPGVYSLTVYADFGLVTRNATITLTIESGVYGRDGYEDVTVGGYIVDSDTSEVTRGIVALMVAMIITVPIVKYSRKTRRNQDAVRTQV
jgi:hypothetical protein